MQTTVSNRVRMTPIAGTSTLIPNSSNLPFTAFGKPVAGQNSLAFYGSNGNHTGIYYQPFFVLAADSLQNLEVVCDHTTDLPTIGKPTAIGQYPVIADGFVYFTANNGINQGIYAYNVFNKEIEELYLCPATEKLSEISASEGCVVFEKNNAANLADNGIWLINKNSLTSLIIKAGTQFPVQINGRPMDSNNYLYKTGRPYLDGENLVFVGELKNNPTGAIGQALIRYNLSAKGLLSVLKDGDTLVSGKELVGGTPFKSALSYHDGHIAVKVEYNTAGQSSTKHMVIMLNSGNSIAEIANKDVINPIAGISLYTSDFALAPMTSKGKVTFVSDVELSSSVPSTNLFSNLSGGLNSYIDGYTYPYKDVLYLQGIDQTVNSFFDTMVVARCFWNNGASGNEDNLGIYAFFLQEAI